MEKHLLDMKDFLDESYLKYHSKTFVENDPILIPHQFSKKEDIEIAGFLTATIAWGNRKSILQNAKHLMHLMDQSPYLFVMEHSKKELGTLHKFVHRTFNGKDCVFFVEALKNIYLKHGGIETAFGLKNHQKGGDLQGRIVNFREIFLETKHLHRSEKHLSNPAQKSSAKRLCMYLRWMVRDNKKKVDFGIWKSISPAELHLPLDVHTGNVARKLGLLQRKQNDWQAVVEITEVLRQFDPKDPVKYDFALFGLGVNKAI